MTDRSHISRIFDSFDSNDDGGVTLDELLRGLATLGISYDLGNVQASVCVSWIENYVSLVCSVCRIWSDSTIFHVSFASLT